MFSSSPRFARFAAIVGPPVVVLAFAGFTLAGLQRVDASRRAVERTYRVEAVTQGLLARLVDVESATRGFVITANEAHLAPIADAHQDIQRHVAELRSLIVDSAQRARLEALVPLVDARLGVLDSIVAVRRTGPVTVAPRSRTRPPPMEEIRSHVAVMNQAQRRLLASRDADQLRWARTVTILLVIGALASAGLALLVNVVFARHAGELEEQNLRLEEQAVELEAQAEELGDTNRQLQDQAAELEAQATELEEAAAGLRESEERFRSLTNNSAEAIVVVQADGRISYASSSAERMLGYAPHTLEGTAAITLVHPSDVEAAETAAAALLAQPRGTAAGQIRALHADGSWRWLEAVGANLLDEPAVGGVAVNARDVTSRREADEALRRSEEQLRQAARMEAVGRLAGGIAHDFNNLLTVIAGNAAMLTDELPPDAEGHVELDQIREASERAAGLTRQLLAFSRRQVVQPRVVELNQVVRGLEKMLRRLISEHIEIRVSLDEAVKPVLIDPGQLEQVLVNLAVNASDAMPEGGRLIIETRNVDVDAGLLRSDAEGAVPAALLAVSDTGVGMDARTQERVFEPFFTTKEPGKGTGLGLSTAYGIVQQAGGAIWLYSEPGQGTTFKIYLPLASADAAEETAPAEATASSVGTETVLLVEDEAAVRTLVRRTLQAAGYDVLAAEGPDAAVRLAQQHVGPIHLLMTDVVMPGRSGKVLAQELTALLPNLKTLFMSGYTDDAISGHGILTPGEPLLEKPFTPAQVAHRVRQVLDAS